MPIKKVRAAARTSTGTQDFTVAGFGTPRAAIFLVMRAAGLETQYDGIVYGMGITDGTRNFCNSIQRQDAVGTSVSNSRNSTSKCVQFMQVNGTTVEGEAAFSSWITDGVRIDWTTATANNVYITCILIGGTDFPEVYAGSQVLDAAGTYDITAPNFAPDLIIAAISHAANNTSQAYGHLSIGFAERAGGTYGCIETECANGQATVQVYATARNDAMLQDDDKVTVTAWDAQGFSAVIASRIWGGNMIYLAIRLNGVTVKAKAENFNFASTGNKNFTGYGFRPGFLFMLPTAVSTINTTASDARGGPGGAMIIDSAGDEDSKCFFTLDNTATADEKSMVSDSLKMYSEANAQDVTASWVSYDADGFTLNFSAVKNSDRYCPVLALSGTAARKKDFMPFMPLF